jgi:putative hemolysin
MMRRSFGFWWVALLASILLLAGCKPVAAPAPPAPQANMPNPASVNCVDKGGTLDIRKDTNGGEVGYCVFTDGSECEEWAFFREECKPGDHKP